ncbi:MAG: class I SAM-dependent methyltransferase [Verrucomicrobiota bacterium]|nr:class I SAM-dependent methyltransferase [Verrucomicrobiota bacterium]
MIATKVAAIDATALMEKVRAEARRLKEIPLTIGQATPSRHFFHLPPVASLPVPTSPTPAGTKFNASKTLDQLRRAAEANDGPRWLPKPLRKLFRRQRSYNQRLLEAVTALARSASELAERVIVQDQAIRALMVARAGDVAWMRTAGEILPPLHLNVQELQEQAKAADDLRRSVSQLDARLTSDSSFIKGELSYYRSALQRLSGLASATDEENGSPSLVSSDAPAGMLDSFYVSFEDRFRGTREAIRARLEHYLPLVQASAAVTTDRPLLDLGCGRGEWLELLRDHGLNARGVDTNALMQAHCVARGLAVLQVDALAHLRSLASGSIGTVSGFHIIEHLPFPILMNLTAEVLRVLAPGGLAIFESPNCKNLVVGASTFYLDPTHRNPVYPETAELMLKLVGFVEVELHYLSPSEGSPFSRVDSVSSYLDDRLFGSQDFGVTAKKARE